MTKEMELAWADGVRRTRALKLAHAVEAAEKCLRAHQQLAAAKRARRRPGGRRPASLALADYMASRKAVQQ